MLRTPTQSALNQTLVSLRQAQHHYARLAQESSPGLNGLFSQLAESRAGMAHRFEEFIQRMGVLPDTPDPDRESLEQLLLKLRQTMGDRTNATIDTALALEEPIQEGIAALRHQSLPDELSHYLLHISERLDEDRKRLRSHRH